MLKLAAILALTLGTAGSAYGWWWDPPPPNWGPLPPVHRAPEIDPAGAMAGLTLLAGGLAVLRSRRSRKK
jgi:hypothetical protein